MGMERQRLMKWWHLGSWVAIGVGGVLPTQAIAAENVVLTYGLIQRSIPVEELSALAKDGEVSSQLKSYFERANVSADAMQNLLTEEIVVDGVVLDRHLNNVIGDALLDRVSEVIYPEPRSAGRGAMRAALVLSAVDDNRVTLIEILENYPTSEVYVDGDRLASAYEDIRSLESVVSSILSILQQLERLPR